MQSQEKTTGSPAKLRVEILETLAHDRSAYTEGLELAGDKLYESTGLSGQSSVRSGPIGGRPTERAELPAPLFGEGIALTGTSLWQLTWQNGIAIERDPDTLAERRRVGYAGEGWGLCAQPERGRLVMSNGSATLTFRDAKTFAITGSVTAKSAAGTYSQLNELECVAGKIYANVWQTDKIVRINGETGAVEAEIDASGMLTPTEKAQADVLNGIAAIPGTDEFLLTGKLWSKMFRVRLIPTSA
jgi:glutamine cyclotransferase